MRLHSLHMRSLPNYPSKPKKSSSMLVQVQGNATYCYTGGKAINAKLPTIVFIHGVLNDHSVWILQSRYFANHGFNVLAVDLPGHGKSAGAPPRLVEEAAGFVIALLDALGIQSAMLAGHSFGSLIAIEAAARAPARITHLALLGTAAPMTVSPTLLEASLKEPLKAIDMVNTYSHSLLAPPPSALGPGTWLYGGSRALMRRVLASNPQVNLFHTGFVACNDYKEAVARVKQAQAAILFIVGSKDQMTPPRAAQSLIDAAPQAQVLRVAAGHQMMVEAPEAVLDGLRRFFKATV
jgi:pimeloyl-ACP methyl ester carboxylesterase